MLNCGLGGLERRRLLSFGNEQFQIRGIATGLCLDVGVSTTPRHVTHLALTTCKAVDSQHWLLTPPAGSDSRNKALASDLSVSHPGPVGLEHVRSGRMLAGEPRGIDGMRVRTYPHRTQPTPNREKWIPEWADEQSVRMRDAATGLCIQTDANLPSDGFLGIDLRACNNSRAQTWRVQPVSENAFRLRNDQPVHGDDACLDMDRLAAGTGLYIVNTTQCGGGDSDSQHWSFAPFDTSPGPDETGDRHPRRIA
ncbi:RICIN domain-containing protein [Streptomyces hesseae]|uniref:Ricin-type beta-trefoil lectin domain protein n=1 Tax=Streptomyces hesseae TaxID=3075519 RepID=A0ABU2SH76_9ACTN|nr:ricin-type beta-trefoil lectin domain protein [Streptomyces sp. DSM 40473]MDT0448322.1 ricin-type beta-trefoil lectin domain protein [Streptomyces sp. DSM 40473]